MGLGEPFRLYYELYGALPDARYRTTIRIEPIEEPGVLPALARLVRGKREFELRFEGVAPGGVVREDRIVETDLAPGPYRIERREELYDLILGHVPPGRVEEVERLHGDGRAGTS